MAILCIDTATADGMVVVAREREPSGTVRWRSVGRHAEDLFARIERAMADADVSRRDLSLIGVSVGPGGFTSLRVGLATAKGLSLGLGIPIVGVSSLRALARSIEGEPSCVRVPMLNAYRGDVFAAAFAIERTTISELVAPTFGPPEEVLTRVSEQVGSRALRLGGPAVASSRAAIERVLGRSGAQESGCTEVTSPEGLLAEILHVYDEEGPSDLVRLEPEYLRDADAKASKPVAGPPRSA